VTERELDRAVAAALDLDPAPEEDEEAEAFLTTLRHWEVARFYGLRVQRGPYESGGFRVFPDDAGYRAFGPQGPVVRAMKGARLREGWRAQDDAGRSEMAEEDGPTRGQKRVVFDVRFTADVPAEVPTRKLRAAFDQNSVVRDPTGEAVRGARWVGEEQAPARDAGQDGVPCLTEDAVRAVYNALAGAELPASLYDVGPLLRSARQVARRLREDGVAVTVEEVLAVWVLEAEFGK
jgi:hypothetical protein